MEWEQQCLSLPFSSLAEDIRAQIWEAYVDERPGMNFLVLGKHDSLYTKSIIPADGAAIDESTRRLKINNSILNQVKNRAKYEKEYPIESAMLCWRYRENRDEDFSHWTTIKSRLAKIRNLCRETRALCKSWDRRVNALHLWDDRQLVSLNTAKDCFCIDYALRHQIHQAGSMIRMFDAEGFDKMRQVAVRFNRGWMLRTDMCYMCSPNDSVLPMHLYQFLAGSFPRLERIWLIDHLLVRPDEDIASPISKHPCEEHIANLEQFGACHEQPHSFTSRACIFHEARMGSWKLSVRVLSFASWLQDAYRIYAKLSVNSVAENPEQVQVGILGCEWKPLDFNEVPT